MVGSVNYYHPLLTQGTMEVLGGWRSPQGVQSDCKATQWFVDQVLFSLVEGLPPLSLLTMPLPQAGLHEGHWDALLRSLSQSVDIY